MPTVVRRYAGHCKVKFDLGVELETDFTLQLRTDGHIEVSVGAPMSQDVAKIMKKNESKGLLPCSLIGTVSTPEGKITIPSLLLDATFSTLALTKAH
jgi:hypothetical protein